MVTQSVAFREPVSDLGQGVFTVPNILPWKQGAAYLLQSDGALISPVAPEKQHKRRRNSPLAIQDQEIRGSYSSQLPNGRLSHGSLQETTEPCLPADSNHFCDFDTQSLPTDKSGFYSGDLENSCGPERTRELNYNLSGVNLAGRMTTTNPAPAIADPFVNSNGEFSTSQYSVGGKSYEAEAAATAQTFANLQALINPAGALDVYSGSGGQAQRSPHIGADLYTNVNTLAYTPGTRNTNRLFSMPNFRSVETSHCNLLGNYNQSAFTRPFVPPSSGNSESNGQMSSVHNMCDTSWDLSSQASVSTTCNTLNVPAVGLGIHVPVTAQETPCTPLLQRRNTPLHVPHQGYMDRNMMVGTTPEKNHEGRRLSHIPAPDQSPNNVFHAFEVTTPHAGRHANVHMSDISQLVESIQTTVDSAVSGITEAIQEDPQQGRFSRTYELPHEPPTIAGEVANGQKEGYRFDLNEVPGANEATPKVRKKYHPRVAKDKRTYKRRASKIEKTNERRMNATPAADGINLVDTSPITSASADVMWKNTSYSMPNGEGRDSSYPDDMDMDFGSVGVGVLPTTQANENIAYSVYSGYATADNAPEYHDLCTEANGPLNIGHDTAVCDCEACIHTRLSQGRLAGNASGTRKNEKTLSDLTLAAEAQVIDCSNRKQPHAEVPEARRFNLLDDRSPLRLTGTGTECEERSSEEVWTDGTEHFREPIFRRFSPGTDGLPLFNQQPGSASARTNGLENFSGSTVSAELSFTEQPNPYRNPSASKRRNFFTQNFTSQITDGGSLHNANASGESPIRGDSFSPHSPFSPQSPFSPHSPVMQTNNGQDASRRMHRHSVDGQEKGGRNNSRSVRRSLFMEATPPAVPEERSLTTFDGSFNRGNDDNMSRLKDCVDSHSRAMVIQQEAYSGVRSCFDQSETPRDSCLQQFNYAAAERGLLRSDSFGETVDLMRVRDMVTRHRDNMLAERRNALFQQVHSNNAISSYAEHGAIVPANPMRYNWSPEFPHNFLPRKNSFMSRLCPRGILSPQKTPFRMMTKIQRIVYLKTILMSHQLDTTPMRLLRHVQGHLPEDEKDAFELLWPLILEPVTKEQLQQLSELAQTEVMSNMDVTKYPGDKRKQPKSKKPSKKELQMTKAMTLWPDLIEQTPRAIKEKGEKSNHRQERQNSNGNISQGLELVPYQGKSMVPYDGPFLPLRKRKPRPKVALDTESVRVWKLLMGKTAGPNDNETDANKELKWEEERRIMKAQADIFIRRMHNVQGDRSFSRWKGSVVDSVVGAFLTQNVNDVLSSSAFMCMRARFPGRGFRGPLQSKAPEELNQQLGNEAGESNPPPLRSIQEPHTGGIQEVSSYGDVTSGPILSAESRPNSLESQESHNEESYTTSLDARQEDTMSWLEEGGRQEMSSMNLQEQQITLSRTLGNTASGTNSVMNFQIMTCTDNTLTEESTGANIDTQLELISLQQGNNVLRDLAAANYVGSELVTGNQQSKGKYVAKGGLTGPERARLEEKQVTARKSFDWEALRDEFKPRGPGEERPSGPPRTELNEDQVDWEAVRRADVEEVANVIKERGLNWILAGRIKAFLERLSIEHGAIDLEWLRSIPTDDTKEFLLSVRGLGLKSVECIRLLTLHHLAFPVDTNVGRICVRLGWVPLEPLPEELQIHLLELYPVQATIQKYLWPRLCTLDQQTLYELHYQMITFGKVFCTKSKPNCNACPMKSDCKHFASALASAKLALPASERPNNGPTLALPAGTSSVTEAAEGEERPQTAQPSMPVSQYCQPIVEEPMTPESEVDVEEYDIEDYPFSVEEVEEDTLMNLYIQETHTEHGLQRTDIANCCSTTNLSVTISESEPVQEMIMEDWGGLAMPSQVTTSLLNSDQDSSPNTIRIVESEVDQESPGVQSTSILVPDAPSQELVLVPPEAANLPVPKLKNIGRLRTVHYVYELPDSHPLLEGMDTREDDDPCTYLLAIWSPGEVPANIPNINDTNEENPFASSSFEGEAESTKATLLVPCRTAMRGSFPLNGTYFQVNEVFADHASSLQPILVPRTLLWNLRRRFVYFGTSVTSIFRGMTVEEIQACFWRGYVCVRGFDRTSRAPKPLVGRLHLQASKSSGKGAAMDE